MALAVECQPSSSTVLTVAELDFICLAAFAARFTLSLTKVDDGHAIPGSFWGEPEAGIVGRTVYVRGDTPLHSLLHELSHVVCMDPSRRAVLDRDAGGSDAEEAAVCYLQILLADELQGVGRERLMADMDAWGYSFRLGSTRAWFEEDAGEARTWLAQHALLLASGAPRFRLRDA